MNIKTNKMLQGGEVGDQVPKKQEDEKDNKHHVRVGGLYSSKKTRVHKQDTRKQEDEKDDNRMHGILENVQLEFMFNRT
jgi:hypothetical protein